MSRVRGRREDDSLLEGFHLVVAREMGSLYKPTEEGTIPRGGRSRRELSEKSQPLCPLCRMYDYGPGDAGEGSGIFQDLPFRPVPPGHGL